MNCYLAGDGGCTSTAKKPSAHHRKTRNRKHERLKCAESKHSPALDEEHRREADAESRDLADDTKSRPNTTSNAPKSGEDEPIHWFPPPILLSPSAPCYMRPRRRLPGDQLADAEVLFGVGDAGKYGGGESGSERSERRESREEGDSLRLS
jgi:hypothetical protein